jgi:extracellular factor (EF) 3-hydroxypalmitic acid methyl ester biosynthesis protein
MSYVALDIFEHLRPEDTQWILASAQLKTIATNSLLVREDDPSDSIFLIADGLFEVYVFSDVAGQIKVGQLGPGEIIGEISWLDRKPVSASVRAVETSSVIALSTAMLDRKLAADAGFAARLLRGIATLTAERLRKTTAQVRRSEWAAGPRSPIAGGADSSGLLDKIGHLKTLVAHAESGIAGDSELPPVELAAKMRKAFAEVEGGIALHGAKRVSGLADMLQAELLPLVRLSQIAERLYAKPRGYGGDFQTIEMIYANAPAGTGRAGALIDGCVLNLAALKAIGNRRRLLGAEILSDYRVAAKEFHVASLACGPAREIFDVLGKVEDAGRLHVSCVDIDREALGHVEALSQERGAAERVRTYHANLIYLATGRQELHLPPQDLIYSVNLIDYLSDELATTLINWMHDRLRPGGRVILGNFHPRNPTKGLMDHVLDWRLTHRDEADMNRLLQGSKFDQPCSRVMFEDDGVDLFAECRKQ